ncbi:MAG TPA: pyridoxal phosphate-dependent aminotransferase, partial [Xanthomonadales bacterium]|nr:pyridoxal phosphate-dependent aminotransferase [Xanthomonadales bacterium]
MKPGNATVLAGAGGEAYVQWVRRAVAHAMHSHDDAGMLFGSSVSEPVELLRQTVEAGFREPITSRYTSVFVAGNPFVMEQLARAYSVSIENILPTTGATGALSLLYRAFLSPGDHVLVESPGFDLFEDIAHALRAHVDCFSRTGEKFEIDLDELESRILGNTRLIVLTNLHNPSGMLISDETLLEVARLAERHNIKVIVDEVYGGYAAEKARPRNAVELSPHLISVSSLTKIYGLSTLRCGWIVAHPDVLAPVRALNDQFEFGVSKLSHAVAALVMENSDVFDAYWHGVMAEARPVMEDYFKQWKAAGLVTGRLPEYGCIAFPKLANIPDTQSFSAWLADQYGVIVVPGELFRAPGHVRIGFALSGQ